MDNMWEKIKKGLKDGAALSMEKIEEYTKLGKLKVEEMAAKRKIERNFMDLGERAFDLIEEGKGSDVAQDLTVRKSVENVSALRDELKEIELKMQEITEASKQDKTEEDSDLSGV